MLSLPLFFSDTLCSVALCKVHSFLLMFSLLCLCVKRGQPCMGFTDQGPHLTLMSTALWCKEYEWVRSLSLWHQARVCAYHLCRTSTFPFGLTVTITSWKIKHSMQTRLHFITADKHNGWDWSLDMTFIKTERVDDLYQLQLSELT